MGIFFLREMAAIRSVAAQFFTGLLGEQYRRGDLKTTPVLAAVDAPQGLGGTFGGAIYDLSPSMGDQQRAAAFAGLLVTPCSRF